jgi:hypothetical protein
MTIFQINETQCAFNAQLTVHNKTNKINYSYSSHRSCQNKLRKIYIDEHFDHSWINIK